MWMTADTHFGHANIIRYTNRPFGGVEQMDQALVDAWNDRVHLGDEVWHLGDVVMGRAEQTLAIISRLHGRKLLIPGNHDRCWTGHRKVGTWAQRYAAAGFTVLGPQQTLQLAGRQVLACHFPYTGDSHGPDRYTEHRPVDQGSWLLHGHVHDSWRQQGRQINVGVDAWEMAPVAMATLEALIAAGPAERACDDPL